MVRGGVRDRSKKREADPRGQGLNGWNFGWMAENAAILKAWR